MVSPCQTQTGPNETQTNLLTGFVSLQTDISWQPERNICENEILDPHVTAAVIWLRVDVSSAPKHFSELVEKFSIQISSSRGAFSQGACR